MSPSQPDETAAHSLRNALQIIANLEPVLYRGIQWAELEWEDMQAIKARIEAALAKLEGPPIIGFDPGEERFPLKEDWDLIPRPAEADRTPLPGQEIEDA